MADKKIVFAELSLVVITVIWGFGFPITRIAINIGYEPNTILAVRFLIAAILLSLIYYKKLKFLNSKIFVFGSVTGIFLFLGFYFQTIGNVYTTPSKNGFITQLNIIFVPFLYYFFFKKKVTRYNIASVIVALIGVFILSYDKNGFDNMNVGDILTFICAIMVAFHITTASYYQKKYDFDPALFVLVNIFTAMILSFIFMISFEVFPTIVLIDLWPLLFLGVLNTALGFLVQSYALKVSLPTKISLIVSLEGVFAAIGSILIIGEVLSMQAVIGGLLIIGGVLILQFKPFENKESKII